MGKRRNTAKTGDRAVYNTREKLSSKSERVDLDEENYLQLDSDDGASSQSSSDEAIPMQQDVMDLGVGGDSDSSDDDSTSDDNDDKIRGNPQDDADESDDSDDDSSSSDSEDEIDYQQADPRSWGKKKSMYYHGDTGDIEIGQDQEDAFDEEEAAKEVESSRFQDMDEGDFMLPDDEGEKKSSELPEMKGTLSAVRDVTKLSSRDKRKFIKKRHPELMPLVSFFSDVCKELRDTTSVATQMLTQNDESVESVGATPEGQQYLLTKSLIANSTALNAAVYLLLKSEMEQNDALDDSLVEKNSSSIQSHPVMTQLQKCNVSEERIKEGLSGKIDNLDDQVNYLVKAAALMGEQNLDDDEEEEESDASGHASETNAEEKVSVASLIEDPTENDTESLDEVEVHEDLMVHKANVLNEARFGLRAAEVKMNKPKGSKRKATSASYFGDLDKDNTMSNTTLLASTINSIEQRSKVAKKKKHALVEEIDETEENSELAQGLKMMEEQLGKLESDEDEVDDPNDNYNAAASIDNSDEDVMNFYNAVANRSKEKKMIKKKRYEVAPKFPTQDNEVIGERAISRAIMKNRGLVAHKAKINRNPRVKKREQYRKALIRRKGAVREVRTDEGHKYAGEETGIKSGISRSRKL